MRKKSWGRLGAAVGVVALLVGGLVGVAAPAQAEHVGPQASGGAEEVNCKGTAGEVDSPQPDDSVGKELCADTSSSDPTVRFEFKRWWHNYSGTAVVLLFLVTAGGKRTRG